MESKTRKETHTDKETRYLAAIYKLKKDISFFAIWDIHEIQKVKKKARQKQGHADFCI